MKRIKILDLENSSRGRDIDIVEPTLSYLELTQKYQIKRDWIYKNPILSIILFNPDMVVVANGIGSYEHFFTVKFAALWGCKVVTFVSEGDYIEDKSCTENFFWGWNKDFVCYEDLSLQWSQRCIDLIKKYIPTESLIKTRIALSGATGFDKYKLCKFMDRNKFKEKYQLKFDRIVGIAGWGFDHFFIESYKSICEESYSLEDIKNFQDSFFAVNKGYKEIIERNPDVLFILKLHPLLIDINYSEFKGLEQLNNVLVLRSEENIYDIINVCDLWLAFESTTALEAWLLDKKTLLFNPLRSDFKRSIVSKGSVMLKNTEDVNRVIQEYYETGNINEFEELKTERDQILSQVIGFSDGKNFIRATEEINNLLNMQVRKKRIFNFFVFRILLDTFRRMIRDFVVQRKIFLYVPILSKKIERYKIVWNGLYTQQEREKIAVLYKKYIKNFLNI